MSYDGYAGYILHVDLASGDVKKEPLDLEVARRFIGGFGLSLKLAYDLMKPGVDPLSPENVIVIGGGPLVGTIAPGSSRVIVTTKFPISGAIGSGSGSMSFAAQLKWAGYDHLVITGRAREPVYLKVFDDDVEICDAAHLWGRDTYEATDELNKQGKCGVMAIGQAGENLVRFSIAMIDKAATVGRGGLGAVMGSKNLKAIVARGTKGVRVSDPQRFMQMIDALYERLKRYTFRNTIYELGYTAMVGETGAPPYNTYSTTTWSEQEIVDRYGPEVYKKVRKGRLACPSCFCGDKEILEVKDGEFAGLLKYQNAFMALYDQDERFRIGDYRKTTRLWDLFDRYGLDLFTFTNLVDFVMHLYEQGVITEEDTEGLPLRRDFDAIMTWVEGITYRYGFGHILADGWLETISKLARDGEQYEKLVTEAKLIKGHDPEYDPRAGTMGTYEFEMLVSPRGTDAKSGASLTLSVPGSVPLDRFKGACSRMGVPQEAIERIFDSGNLNIGRFTKWCEDWYTIFSSLGVCTRAWINRFYHAELCAELYSAATGIELSRQDLMTSAERSWNMYKVLNVQEGFSRDNDAPPQKWFEPVQYRGREVVMTDYYNTRSLTTDDVNRLLDDYYDERGWDRQKGIPTKQKLAELGLGYVAQDLSAAGSL